MGPHPYHRNLPPHYIDPSDGVPFVTKWAERKARHIVMLVNSIQLTEDVFLRGYGCGHPEGEDNLENMRFSQGSYEATHDDDIDGCEEDGEDVSGDDFMTDDEDRRWVNQTPNMASIVKKCHRIHSQLTALERLKHRGITQAEYCAILLKVLNLLCATVSFEHVELATNGRLEKKNALVDDSDEKGEFISKQTTVQLRFDNVGYVYSGERENYGSQATIKSPQFNSSSQPPTSLNDASINLEKDLADSFALPSPARESLISIALLILSKKSLLRSVSNKAMIVPGIEHEVNGGNSCERNDSTLLIIHWKALLRLLLRTAPYLDNKKTDHPPHDSASHHNNVLRGTINLIRSSRRFFDQGLQIKENILSDFSAREIWSMFLPQLLPPMHSNNCLRSSVLLYLFHPSRCSSEYYSEVLPTMVQVWCSIDRTPHFDFIWLSILGRARKYIIPQKNVDGDDLLGFIQRRILTLCGLWFHIPVGGSSTDKLFPHPSHAPIRSLPPALKTMIGLPIEHETGDFIRKIAKLLIFCMLQKNNPGEEKQIYDRSDESEHNSSLKSFDFVRDLSTTSPTNAIEKSSNISKRTEEVIDFLRFISPYLNPSNSGPWTVLLGLFLHSIASELCRHIGLVISNRVLLQRYPAVASVCAKAEPFRRYLEISDCELVCTLDSLLPLCQQAILSKNDYVRSLATSALSILASIDPVSICPPIFRFGSRALDVCSVNVTHQTPAALSAVAHLLQPLLRRNAPLLFRCLPEIMRLSLAGIDCNDRNKTLKTLILYWHVASWLPLGRDSSPVHSHEKSFTDGFWRLEPSLLSRELWSICGSKSYESALSMLPDTSLLHRNNAEFAMDQDESIFLEIDAYMSDWVLELLDRLFSLFRATGEKEKKGKAGQGVASRHSSADASRAKAFSKVLKATISQIFSSTDTKTYELSVQYLQQFLKDETIPFAAKDVATLCEAICHMRHERTSTNAVGESTVGILICTLARDLTQNSVKTSIYRIRCLSGTVRFSGPCLLTHIDKVQDAILFALSSSDKHLFKAGCKLLRHTLFSLCASFPLASNKRPGFVTNMDYGKPAALSEEQIQWHVPTSEQLSTAAMLLRRFVTESFASLAHNSDRREINAADLRRLLKTLRYCLRGCSSILLDNEQRDIDLFFCDPHERATRALLSRVPDITRQELMSFRSKIASLVVCVMSLVARYSVYDSGSQEKGLDSRETMSSLAFSDRKVCKETLAIARILLTCRGPSFNYDDAKTLWDAQKDSLTETALAYGTIDIRAVFEGATQPLDTVLYNDGEDGGKMMPRTLLVARVDIFFHLLHRNSTFDQPRRLWRSQGFQLKASRSKSFSVETDPGYLLSTIESRFSKNVTMSSSADPNTMNYYEGLMDGLFAFCCHGNVSIRGAALNVINHTFSRFGWFLHERLPRLYDALSLQDGGLDGTFGLPSCVRLCSLLDPQGKRRKLADTIKGICSIATLPRPFKVMMSTEERRVTLVKTVCESRKVVSLLPAEEKTKIIVYFHEFFKLFRSRFFHLPRLSQKDCEAHRSLIIYLTKSLQSMNVNTLTNTCCNNDESLKSPDLCQEALDLGSDSNDMHWRYRLLIGWFVLRLIDRGDFSDGPKKIEELWEFCLHLIQSEVAQPLQRIALAIFGRLVSLSTLHRNILSIDIATFSECNKKTIYLQNALTREEFCCTLSQALVYNHKDDSTVGGGHGSQWSEGVEDMLRDVNGNVASFNLFPFQRDCQLSAYFKVQHARLVQNILLLVGDEESRTASAHFLAYAKVLATKPPSEDQRNEYSTSAEIFAGVCRSWLVRLVHDGDINDVWEKILLPFMEEVIESIPISLVPTYFDAILFAISNVSYAHFYPLTAMLVRKVELSLWRALPNESDVDTAVTVENLTSLTSSEGFSMQSKYLHLIIPIISVLSVQPETNVVAWYSETLTTNLTYPVQTKSAMTSNSSTELIIQRLLPSLLQGLGHPYESCRGLIAGCLSRICRLHSFAANSCLVDFISIPEDRCVDDSNEAPSRLITRTICSIADNTGYSARQQYHALMTARIFTLYCFHRGDSIFEYPTYILRLLPLLFEAVKLTSDDSSGDELTAAQRMLQAEVVKYFRQTIADVSASCIIAYYGNTSHISLTLDSIEQVARSSFWQVRHAIAHFLRCFQGNHIFMFTAEQLQRITDIVSQLLFDDRHEVSAAALAALTGILASTAESTVADMVDKYVSLATKSINKSLRGKTNSSTVNVGRESSFSGDRDRSRSQQLSVFFLCAAVLSRPYDTPKFVPIALAAISRHSFEGRATMSVREVVKMCCSEFKRTHMSDNWELHKKRFSQEQLEALEDVVSTPHYYA